ncbi:biofilm regulation protein kinase SiaB [Paludibacterium yongneupense]|uniref:biofilm regulation protein kinase SiaB n=1 Tax=Paludibacterium yongneupense TaxID=400061 RepID=UPI0004019C86|nr:biofilm regulation protein kinase SiaB [Paludibacterium yongneupense]
MEQIDVLSLREAFNRQGIVLCFNGPFSASLIEEIGLALRKHMASFNASQSAVSDVFSVYIEMTQNIRHYSRQKELTGSDAHAVLIVSRREDGAYVVCSGNVVEAADGPALMARLAMLATLDRDQLKLAYKTQLRQPHDPDAATGAGLGLIDLARKARAPLLGTLKALDETRSFFSLCAVI